MTRPRFPHRLFILLLGGLLVACVHRPDPAFHPLAEFQKFSTADQEKLLLPFDAYVIGLEKDNTSRVGQLLECSTSSGQTSAEPTCLHINDPYFSGRIDLQANLRKLWDPARQRRPIYVSHIARFDSPYEAPCFLSNVYAPAKACARINIDGSNASVAASWGAMTKLHEDLREQLSQKRPTHVLVYSMGC